MFRNLCKNLCKKNKESNQSSDKPSMELLSKTAEQLRATCASCEKWEIIEKKGCANCDVGKQLMDTLKELKIR